MGVAVQVSSQHKFKFGYSWQPREIGKTWHSRFLYLIGLGGGGDTSPLFNIKIMNTQIIIHTGQYAGGIEDGEILFQVDEGVNFIPNVGDTLYIKETYYKVVDRCIDYKKLDVMSFCTAYILVKNDE